MTHLSEYTDRLAGALFEARAATETGGHRAIAVQILASPVLARIVADAWDQGHRAGAMWDYTQHTEPEYSPNANPYRTQGGAA